MDNTKLIAALEDATGPDRELDFALLCLVEPRAKETSPMHYDPHFTASIDAALTLVPEGWDEFDLVCIAKKWFCKIDAGVWYGASYAPTPALAICIAALRAREAQLPHRPDPDTPHA